MPSQCSIPVRRLGVQNGANCPPGLAPDGSPARAILSLGSNRAPGDKRPQQDHARLSGLSKGGSRTRLAFISKIPLYLDVKERLRDTRVATSLRRTSEALHPRVDGALPTRNLGPSNNV